MTTKSPVCIITGAAGFIGSHVLEHFHRKTEWDLVVFDKLSYASCGLSRITSKCLDTSSRVSVFTVDLAAGISEGVREEIDTDRVQYIIHLAAESHVDRSISDPVPFVQNNVNSTLHLLEYARTLPNLKKFFMFSTDEVYGPCFDKPGGYVETDPHTPTNPYSASKSMTEQLCLAYENTYFRDGPDVLITNMVNAFGQTQVEKFFPMVVRKLLAGETIDVHTYPDGKTPGSRFYIHARNVADAVLFLCTADTGSHNRYHITSGVEVDNLDLILRIAKIMGIDNPSYRLVDFHSDRPGHDCRYDLNGERLSDLGWKCPVDFDESLKTTVKWYVDHPQWLR